MKGFSNGDIENRKLSILGIEFLVVILGLVYVVTLLPGVGYRGDTAEFQFVGKALGTAHITGYPTYTILNYLFVTFFPLGTLAYKANLLSSIFAIITCIVLFLSLVLLKFDYKISFIAALSFGLTYTFWSQSIVAEVYTLHAMFMAIVIYFFLLWNKSRKNIYLYGALFFYALSFGNHMSAVTFAPGILYFVWTTDKKAFVNVKNILLGGLFFLLGFSQYAYIYWRTLDPSTAYLAARIPNFQRFVTVVTGGGERLRMFQDLPFASMSVLPNRIPHFCEVVLRQYLWLTPLILLGVLRFKNRNVNVFLLLCSLGNALWAIDYSWFGLGTQYFLIPVFLISAFHLGNGVKWIMTRMVWPSRPRITRVLRIVFLISMPLTLCAFNYVDVNQQNNVNDAREVKIILETVKRDAVIIVPNHEIKLFFLYYTIGEEFQRYNIYVEEASRLDIEDVRGYVYENKPLQLFNQRARVPAGYDLYCLGGASRTLLEEAGFTLNRVQLDATVATYRLFRASGQTGGY